MAKLYLVRHARPSAGWGEDPDPGLHAVGHEQADAAARALAAQLPPMPIYTSPLRRCRETAQPLEALWQVPAQILQAVAELPSPPLDLKSRHSWLVEAMQKTWRKLAETAPAGSPDYLAWRQTLLSAIVEVPQDSVIFTHFISINACVGAANARAEVVCFRPDHASITRIDTYEQRIRVIELGHQAQTSVLGRS
jgi:broad specificity phosphatase PhoE